MRQHKYSLSNRQIQILDELMDANKGNNGVCYHDKEGKYIPELKQDLDFLKYIGFVSEYMSEQHITPTSSSTQKSWTITYHGIAFLFAYHSSNNTKPKKYE